MGADAYAYLYVTAKFEDVFKAKTTSKQFELHDKRGNATGQFETETTTFFERISDGKIYSEDELDRYLDDYRHSSSSESDDYFIGISIGKCDSYDKQLTTISPSAIEPAAAKLREVLNSPNLKTELTLSLYWSC